MSAHTAAQLADLRRESLLMIEEDWLAQRKAQEPLSEPVKAPPGLRDRPQGLDEMVGQKNLVRQLRMICAGSMLRGTTVPHILLTGPAGHGKSSLGGIIANELEATMVETTGMTLKRPQDLIGMLVKMQGTTVFFIDEVHALPKAVMECLYEAMEDGKISAIAGSGADAVAHVHNLPPFICVGATTRPGLLTTPFRQRFGFAGTVDPYTIEELSEIVGRAWTRVGMKHTKGESEQVAKRCKGVPRIALHLAERVQDFCAVHDDGSRIPKGRAAEALRFFNIDERGLDRDDYRILSALTGQFAGRTVGLDVLAQALDMDAKTISEQHEPYLSQQGFISRTKTGRMALPAAYELLQ